MPRHGYAHIPHEGSGLSGQDAGEGVQLRIHRVHCHVADVHSALVGHTHSEAHRAGHGVDHAAVRGSIHRQGNDLGGIHGGQRHAAGGSLHLGTLRVLPADGELVVRRLGDGDLLFQLHGFARLHRLPGEHLAQQRIGDGHVLVVRFAGVLQRQRQLHRVAHGAALFVRCQGRRQVHLAILDGGCFLLDGLGGAVHLVGDGGLAGQVLSAHRHREGIAGLLPCRDGCNGAGLGGDAAVLLDGDIRHLHVSGVHHLIGDGNLLPLLGRGGGNGAVDLQVGHRAGVRDGLGEAVALVDELPIIVVHGVFQLEGNLARIQLGLGHRPRAAPGLGRSHRQRGGAELLHLLAIGIVQRAGAGHVALAHIGHLDRHRDALGLGKLIGAQLHGDLQGICLRTGHRAQAHQRRHHHQGHQQPSFHRASGGMGRPSSFRSRQVYHRTGFAGR